MINTHENKIRMFSQEETDQIFPYNKRFCLLLSSLSVANIWS